MNKLKLALMIVGCGLILTGSEKVTSNFQLLDDERSIFEISNFHFDFIGFVLNKPIPLFPLRWPDLKGPGDYFRHPAGADELKLTNTDIKEVEGSLDATVSPRYYDSYILDNLTGYEYELLEGKVSRREYYVKYSRGDTIFVISGLLGKFLSFYRAIPGEFRLSIDQLKEDAAQLSTSLKLDDNDSFVEKENDYIYFIEHIDRKGKLRVRNYQVVESWQEADKDRDDSIGKYYNLIEITKFLDEEAMP